MISDQARFDQAIARFDAANAEDPNKEIFEGKEYPRMSTITTYSLSQNVNSPWYKDQTWMYSNKQWIDLPFSEADIAAQTLSVLELSE